MSPSNIMLLIYPDIGQLKYSNGLICMLTGLWVCQIIPFVKTDLLNVLYSLWCLWNLRMMKGSTTFTSIIVEIMRMVFQWLLISM